MDIDQGVGWVVLGELPTSDLCVGVDVGESLLSTVSRVCTSSVPEDVGKLPVQFGFTDVCINDHHLEVFRPSLSVSECASRGDWNCVRVVMGLPAGECQGLALSVSL